MRANEITWLKRIHELERQLAEAKRINIQMTRRIKELETPPKMSCVRMIYKAGKLTSNQL